VRFDGKTALVTGGTRGIGAALVVALAEAGADVAYTGTAAERPEGAPDGRYLPLDLADAADTERFCAELETWERLDILVNNAGINIIEPIDAIDEAHWRRVLDVNLTGAMLVTRSAARVMERAGRGGRVLMLGSIFSFVSREMRDAYSASKTGLLGLVRAAALDLAGHGILVNAVCPGPTMTDLTASILTDADAEEMTSRIPLGRFAAPQEIAAACAFLVSDLNTYMTGTSLVVDGGYVAR